METMQDLALNPPPALQKGDYVAFTFFISAMALTVIGLFILFQLQRVAEKWRTPVIMGLMVTLVAAANTFYRREHWVSTQTIPVEFRFFDWFLTVPLMAMMFYYWVKPYGAKPWMLIGIFISSLIMLVFGYVGEAVYPEYPVFHGIMGAIGLGGIVAFIMAGGYPILYRRYTTFSIDPVVRKGYTVLSVMLPLGWSVYPAGYMTVPGNILESVIHPNTVIMMYNFADIINKGGLALGAFLIALYSLDNEKRHSGRRKPGSLREQPAVPAPPPAPTPVKP
ncbi:MAG: bacteriorhodopsin [Bacteroidia bacterium]|nr:bacteriorhodopsin [Bacteroidia bacterium]